MGSSRRLWPVSIVVGVGLGAFSVLADGIIGGRLFGILGNIASPWGLAAFFVGRLTTSPKRGALAGALTLLVGVAVYYAVGAARGYVVGEVNLVWTAIALVAGPVMGWSGAAISSGARTPTSPRGRRALGDAGGRGALPRDRPEGLALRPRRRTYRLIDLGVMLALLVGGLLLPWIFEKDRHRRRIVYLFVVLAGVGGAIAFVVLRGLISRIV